MSDEHGNTPIATDRRYGYRCTTAKLLEHVERIEETGDVVVEKHFVGGRDWLLIVERGRSAPARRHGDLLPGVPSTITRAAVRDLAASIGLDTANLREIHMTPGSVRAVVFALGANGQKQIGQREVATHEIYIEVVD